MIWTKTNCGRNNKNLNKINYFVYEWDYEMMLVFRIFVINFLAIGQVCTRKRKRNFNISN